MDPFFSVVIPTYNRSQLLKAVLLSLKEQSFTNFEAIIVDDGGTDDSQATVEAINDSRFTYIWKENAERGAARNFGAGLAKGRFVNFFDSDDLAYGNHLQTAFEFIRDNPGTVVFHTSYDWLTPSLQRLQASQISNGSLNSRIMKNNLLSCNNVFIRSDVFNQLKFSERRLLSGTEDWLLWIRLAARYEITGLATITSAVIQHGQRSMLTATGASTLARTLIIREELKNDEVFMKKHASRLGTIQAECYSLTALCWAIEKRRGPALYYFAKAVFQHFPTLFTRRTLATFKHLLLPG
jgi:glycosyltransferase involved in cell wall biosynthesis